MTARSLLRPPPKETPVSVRFQPETLARLDRVANALSRKNVRVGRSSVVKFAIERVLVTLEAGLALAPVPTLSSKHP
jgi:predicted transcriptional regulator